MTYILTIVMMLSGGDTVTTTAELQNTNLESCMNAGSARVHHIVIQDGIEIAYSCAQKE